MIMMQHGFCCQEIRSLLDKRSTKGQNEIVAGMYSLLGVRCSVLGDVGVGRLSVLTHLASISETDSQALEHKTT